MSEIPDSQCWAAPRLDDPAEVLVVMAAYTVAADTDGVVLLDHDNLVSFHCWRSTRAGLLGGNGFGG